MNLSSARRPVTVCCLAVVLWVSACSEKPDALLASAKAYLEQGNGKAALIQVKNALQIDPDLPEGRFLLGSALLESGDLPGAEAELRKALDLKHPRDRVVPLLAKTLLAQGHHQTLIDEFGRDQFPQTNAQASLQMALSAAYAGLGQRELATASLNAALLADPEYPPALIQRAHQMARQRDFEGALALAQTVLAKAPASYEAWKLKGDIYLHGQNKTKDALAAYRQSVQIKPDFLPGHGAIVNLLLQQGSLVEAAAQVEQVQNIAPNNPRTHYLAAHLAFEKKDYAQARDRVQQILRVAPDNLQALQLAGSIELQLNALPQAQGYLSKALQAVPTLPLARRLLVMSYLRSGQPDKALETLLPGLAKEPVEPRLLSLAGEVYLQNGDIGKAEAYFAQAAKQAPRDGKKRTSLALVHLLSGSTDAAFDELREIAVSDTGTTADLALISAHLKRKEWDKAQRAIAGLERKLPGKPLPAYLRAHALLAQQDTAGARKNLEQAVTLDPGYFPAAARLAGLDMVDKKPESAKMRFETVLRKDPKNKQALLALAELASQSGASAQEVAKLIGNAVATHPSDANARLLLIDFYARNGDFKNALSAAQNANAALADNPPILDALGRAQAASGEFHQAVATYTQLTRLLPQTAWPYKRLSDAQLGAGDKDTARTSLKKALAVQPDFLDAQRILIALDLEAGRTPDALATARSIEKQRPKETVGYALEGDIHAWVKHWDEAASAYRLGLKQLRASELALKLHSVLQTAGKSTEADQWAATWLKENPKDAAFQFYLGDVALARKDYTAAEKSFGSVIQLQPQSAIAFNNLAWVTAKLKKDGAIAYAEKAISLAPSQPTFVDTLATLQSDKGNYRLALELQTKALALQPANPTFKLNLARIHIKGGNKDLAKKELDELHLLGDKFSGQAEVNELLKNF